MQISGKAFQVAFRERKIPFNIHGVAFYRKKVSAYFFYLSEQFYVYPCKTKYYIDR